MTQELQCESRRFLDHVLEGESIALERKEILRIGANANKYLHMKIRPVLLFAYGSCSMCGYGNLSYLDSASINHVYTENLNEWILLCKRCHDMFDGRSKARIGISFTEEHKRNISQSKKGKPSPNISLAQTVRFNDKNNHPFYGKHHSIETKKKISEALKKGSNTVCEVCGKEVYRAPSHNKRYNFKYCSLECVGKGWKTRILLGRVKRDPKTGLFIKNVSLYNT